MILLVLCWLAVGYGYGLARPSEAVTDTELYMDGTDLSLFTTLMGYGVNGILGLVNFVVYAVVLFVGAWLLVLLLRAIGIHKGTVIAAAEHRICSIMTAAAAVVSVVIGLILTHGTGAVTLIVFTVLWLFPLWLIYLREMRHRITS